MINVNTSVTTNYKCYAPCRFIPKLIA